MNQTKLNEYFSQNITIRQNLKQEALAAWEKPVKEILEIVQARDYRFKLKLFMSGSFYERAKVKSPDEFDIMLEMDKLSLEEGPYEAHEDSLTRDPPDGFTTVLIDLGEEEQWQRDDCIGHGAYKGLLNATKVKSVFARLVSQAIQNCSFIRQTSEGPAVTLKITKNRKIYSIDLTLAIKDALWPEEADEWKSRSRRGWPTQQMIREVVGAGCHLIAKKPRDVPYNEGSFFWRYSFSAAEKKLLTQVSQGQAASCQKKVLRILKAFKDDYNMTPLTSYHMKTTMLYECEQYPNPGQWQESQLGQRVRSALQRLLARLQDRRCPHYFIKDVNLFQSNFNGEVFQRLIHTVCVIQRDYA